MAGENSLPEAYHLEGSGNYGVWSYRMKNLLQRDGRFKYCTTKASEVMGDAERMARQQVMSLINSSAKNNALRILRRYVDPYECWMGLKTRYESDSGPRRVMLIEKFFSLRKTDSVSMDEHLTEVKEVANLLEEVEVIIPEDIIVYYTLKNLPKEYEIFRRMQIAAQKLPTYEQLEAKLISEETSIKMESQKREEGEALLLHQNPGRRPQQNARYGNFAANPRPRRQTDVGGPSTFRAQNSAASGGFQTAPGGTNMRRPQSGVANLEQQRRGPVNTSTFQPRFKPRGT